MKMVFCFALLLAMSLPLTAAEPVVARWTVTPTSEPIPALRYRLLPTLIDLKPGNAAVIYNKLQSRLGQDDEKVLQDLLVKCEKLSAKEMPHEDLKKFFDRQEPLLTELHRAARRKECDWQTPVGEQEFFSIRLDELQPSRQFARLLALHVRWRLSQGDFDGAHYSLQSCFALARHVNQGPTLIHGLVAASINLVALQQIEFWIQQPAAPNLYWALTTLPQPLVDPRLGYEGEMSSLFFGDPALAALDRNGPLDANVEAAVERLMKQIWPVILQSGGTDLEKFTQVAQTLAGYPKARAWLLKQGKSEAEVSQMKPEVVIALHTLQTYRELRDENFKWFYLPPQERNAIPKNLTAQMKKESSEREIFPLAGVLMPAIEQASSSLVQVDREVTLLRTVEALRLFAASHGNRWPVTGAEVTATPVPRDPVTGQHLPLAVQDGTATITLPSVFANRPERKVELTIAK